MTDIESLQKKYRFPVQMKDRDEKGTPKRLIEVQEAMYADIKLLRGKYKLSEAYQLAIGIFVQEGHVNASIGSEHWYLNPYFYPTESRNCITLRLYAENRKGVRYLFLLYKLGRWGTRGNNFCLRILSKWLESGNGLEVMKERMERIMMVR